MKNDNTLVLGLLISLFLFEISNQIHDIRIKKQLNHMQQLMTEYFAPLPDVDFQEEPQDGRIK
jgi:hypothetical protein